MFKYLMNATVLNGIYYNNLIQHAGTVFIFVQASYCPDVSIHGDNPHREEIS